MRNTYDVFDRDGDRHEVDADSMEIEGPNLIFRDGSKIVAAFSRWESVTKAVA